MIPYVLIVDRHMKPKLKDKNSAHINAEAGIGAFVERQK
jgi:hypothetical protein